MAELSEEDSEKIATAYEKRFQQFFGLFLKRFHHSRRNFKGLISQIFLPAIFVCIAMTVAMLRPGYETQPQLILSPTMIRPLPNFIPFNNEGHSQISKSMENTLRLASGIGADCVLKHANNSRRYTKDVLRLHSKFLEFYDGLCKRQLSKFKRFHGQQHENAAFSKKRRKIDVQNKKCRCSDDKRSYICDEGVEGNPDEIITITGDKLVNITGRNMEQYLLYTTQHFRRHR